MLPLFSPLQVTSVLVTVTAGRSLTLKVTSSWLATQSPSAAIVYLIFTSVSPLLSLGVYTFPLMFPPPETIDQVPPAGVAVNVLVSLSVIEALEVVLLATTSQTGVTVNVISSDVAAQEPDAGMVYLIVTSVFVLISAGVYTLPLIEPPPETIDQVPPAGVPLKVFVSFSVIFAVAVVLSAVSQGGTEQLKTLWNSAGEKLAI